jgi:tripartite-type tricarboxylate transporter receptor subunit TctC
LVALLLLAASPLQAQPYPSKPVRIITQAAAGSGPDVIGRIVADHLTRRWGQPALIINHPGAGGSIAAKAAALSEPDGYTLYMASGSALMVLPETHANLPFDFDRDFIPIGMVGRQPMLIAVSPTLDVSSLPDLIALAKRRPGEILFAGNTRGALPHLTGEMFRQRSGADLTFVPYPGSAAAFHDLLGGRISMIVEGVSGLAATSRSARSSCSRSHPRSACRSFPTPRRWPRPFPASRPPDGLRSRRAPEHPTPSLKRSVATCARLWPTRSFKRDLPSSAPMPLPCRLRNSALSCRANRRCGSR